jgi:hypothetical protein
MVSSRRRPNAHVNTLLRALITSLAIVTFGTTLHAQTTVTTPTFAQAVDRAVASALATSGSGAAARFDARVPESGTDWPMHIVVGAFVVSATADVAVSTAQIQRGVARERGFGAWLQDSPVPFVVTKGLVAASFVYGVRQLRKTRPKTAMAFGIVATAVEAGLAVRSARIAAPR